MVGSICSDRRIGSTRLCRRSAQNCACNRAAPGLGPVTGARRRFWSTLGFPCNDQAIALDFRMKRSILAERRLGGALRETHRH